MGVVVEGAQLWEIYVCLCVCVRGVGVDGVECCYSLWCVWFSWLCHHWHCVQMLMCSRGNPTHILQMTSLWILQKDTFSCMLLQQIMSVRREMASLLFLCVWGGQLLWDGPLYVAALCQCTHFTYIRNSCFKPSIFLGMRVLFQLGRVFGSLGLDTRGSTVLHYLAFIM